jgi:hypothetical protein
MPLNIGTHGAHGPVKPFEFILPHFNNPQVLSLAWMYGPVVATTQQTYSITVDDSIVLLSSLPPAAWDEVDWQKFAGIYYSQETTEEDTGFVPIIPVLAWDEVDQQKFVSVNYSNQTVEEDVSLFPVIPVLAWDETDQQKFVGTNYSNETTEEDTSLLPIIPNFAYEEDQSKNIDIRQQQDDDPWHTFFFVPVSPPNLGWDDWDWNKNFDIRFGLTTQEEYWNETLATPILFFDEFEEQYNSIPNIILYPYQDVDWQSFFIIPSLAYDEDQSKNVDIRQQQDDDPWHTFYNIPLPPPNIGWDDWDWNKSFADVRQQQDDEPWQTFFIIPTPPPNLGWDDYDWSKVFQIAFSSQTLEEDIDSLPFISPFVFEEFNFYSGDDHAE